MLHFKSLDPRYSLDDAVGLIPMFLVESDPRPAAEQIAERYCGGWFDLKVGPKGFRIIGEDELLLYPGDPPLRRLAEATLHGEEATFGNLPMERIVVYQSAFVVIHQTDGSFRVSRLD